MLPASGLSFPVRISKIRIKHTKFVEEFGVSSLYNKKGQSSKGLPHFGASVLIGHFEKYARTYVFLESDIFEFDPHPYWMRCSGRAKIAT